MPKQPRLTASDADRLLKAAGFVLLRTKGSHHIYGRDIDRVVVPFHGQRPLHPKIVRQILEAVEGK